MRVSKRLILAGALVIAALVMASCAVRHVYPQGWGAKCPEAPLGGLILSESMDCYPVGEAAELEQVFTKAMRRIAEKRRASDTPENVNLIVFVHGRGAHPKKEVNERLMHYLEEENEAVVIMYHWPSVTHFLGWPIKEAHYNAREFGEFLSAFARFKAGAASEFGCDQGLQNCDVKSSLLVHSMGNSMMQEALHPECVGCVDAFSTPMFDTLILSAAPINARGHGDWLAQINLASHQYVVVNRGDWFIDLGGRVHLGARVLGQCVEEPTAGNFTYVNASNAKVRHRYFINEGEHKRFENRPRLVQFFNETLNGRASTLAVKEDSCPSGANCPRLIDLDGTIKHGIYCGQ